jgi:hypothetical protein
MTVDFFDFDDYVDFLLIDEDRLIVQNVLIPSLGRGAAVKCVGREGFIRIAN